MKKILTAALTVAMAAGAGLAPALTVQAAPKVNTNYTGISTWGSGLVLEPSLTFEPSTVSQLSSAILSPQKPASVLLTPDEEMKVLGRSLASLYDNYLTGNVIPVLRLTEATIAPFLHWLENEYTIYDMMVVSDDIGVLDTLYADEIGYLLNTVYDLTSVSVPENRYDLFEYVGEANEAGCNTLLFDAADPNLAVAADYVSAMTKCCWAQAETEEEAVAAIAAGCYGVVATEMDHLSRAVSYFSKSGWAKSQHIAAHRGITEYANENSLTAVAAAANEGATHVEVDIQVTMSGDLVMAHDSGTSGTTAGRPNIWFASSTTQKVQSYSLNEYSGKYGETYPTLDEMIAVLSKTDVIAIIELKLDNASEAAVNQIKGIKRLADTMARHPEMTGRWIAITFYRPFAEQMKELLPQIPVAILGGARAGVETAAQQPAWQGEFVEMTDIANRMKLLRKLNMTNDESYTQGRDSMAQRYLARGFTTNTWTYNDLSHFGHRANIATTDKAEECAMLVKEIPSEPLTLTQAEWSAKRVTLPCTTYNGWTLEKECTVIPVSEGDGTHKVLLYCDDGVKGLYSELVTVTVA